MTLETVQAKVPIEPARLARTLTITRVIDALRQHPYVLKSLHDGSFLVTGALGYFGQYVIDVLLALTDADLLRPTAIYALDTAETPLEVRQRWLAIADRFHVNLPRGGRRYLLHIFRHDAQHGLPVELNERPPTHIWHLAGIASPYWYERKPWETINAAVDGLRAMMNEAGRRKAKLLFTSSSEVYQTANVVPTPESFVGAVPTRTRRSCYDVSKLLGETIMYLAHEYEGLHTVTLRIFNSFGVGMAEGDRRILPRVASAVVGGWPLPVYSDMPQEPPRRTYTPVANTLLGFFLAATRGAAGAVYNVGLDSPELSVVELLARVNRVLAPMGKKVEAEHHAPPANYATEPLRRCPDITALRQLGFTPCMELDEGLELFFTWALATYKGEK